MAGAKDCTTIVFDVGANTSVFDKQKEKTFFEEAKGCIESIITRKIFNKPNDEISLILVGTKTNDVDLKYDNITHAIPMSPMSWNILKHVQQDIEPPSDVTGDWLSGIVVAMDEFHELNLKKCSKKIILFTTFTTDVTVNEEDKKRIIAGLKNEEIELIVVSKNVIYDTDDDNEDQFANFSQAVGKDNAQEKSENLILDIVKDCDGTLASLDDAVAKVNYVDKKSRNRRPWNADLMIGSKFPIKIAAYIYVQNERELATWKLRYVRKVPALECDATVNSSGTSGLDSNIVILPVSTKTEYFYNDEVMDAEAAAELISGYTYGGEAVDFEHKFESGDTGLKCIGFTRINEIRNSYLTGDKIWVVVPQKSTESSTKRFAALRQAMENLDRAIVARYVYRSNAAPKLMALFPSEDSMLMHELHFKDNHVPLEFPFLNSEKNAPNAEQLNFMGNFIDSMDLTGEHMNMDVDEAVQPSECFKELLDPGLQYKYRAIANRAINPGEPLLKVDKDVIKLITAPKKPDIEGLKALFPLKEVKLTGKEKFLKNMRGIGKEEASESNGPAEIKPDYSDIHEIGTVKPADDFMKLLDRGEPFNTLTSQIQQVIVNLAVKSLVAMDEKILQALLAYRETARQKAPFKYNEWMTSFKDILKEREKNQLWQSLVNESLGLITEKESEMSTVSEEEAKSFAKLEDFNTTQAQTNNNDISESNQDMFDDM